jgi:hypothetical protein
MPIKKQRVAAMLNLENIKVLLPERFRLDFTFYPIVILLITFIVFLVIGLRRGIKTFVNGKKEDPENNNNLIRNLCSIQIICLLTAALSIYVYEHPSMGFYKIGWEIGIAFAIAMAVLFFMIGPAILRKVDYILFIFGEIPAFVYGLFKGRDFRPGSMVVQTVRKHSSNPGPRAREVCPETHGDYIDYVVDKFRRVVSVASGEVTVITRRGKLVRLKVSDPTLRKARLFERIRYRDKFPQKK